LLVTHPDVQAAELLRTIASDVSHEIRGPVQSILVNLEVLRRRAQNGDTAALLERADIIESEVQRLHELADAFLALMRGQDKEPHAIAVESVLASLDPILSVRAKTARLTLKRLPADDALLVRVQQAPLLLAILTLFVGFCDALSTGDTILLSAQAAGNAVVFQLNSQSAAPPARPPIEAAVTAAQPWLHSADGTASLETGSDSHRIALSVRVPRAILTTTSSGE
jgi:signal transduction histidine kinase